jgi:hypothetical protein
VARSVHLLHYPSGQNLDYTDARNLNRTYPDVRMGASRSS